MMNFRETLVFKDACKKSEKPIDHRYLIGELYQWFNECQENRKMY